MMLAYHSGPMGYLQFLVLIAGVVAAVISAIIGSRRRDNRVAALLLLRERLQFDSFNPGYDYNFVLGWGFLTKLSQGEERYAFNLLRGTYHDRPLYVFDFHYRTGSGKSEQHHYCTMLMLVTNESFPQLTVKPESFGERIASAIGLTGDIQFESAEFSKTFSVRCEDKKFAYDVCNPQMMEYLLANRDLQVEIQGPVISMAFEPQLPVGEIESNLQRLAQVRALMPDYLFSAPARPS